MSNLLSAAALASLIDSDKPLRILDVRWRLDSPDGRADYEAGHVPGAVYVDLGQELTAVGIEGRGRHPEPDNETLQTAARGWGINTGDLVVAYDDVRGLAASRAWWLLRRAGVDVKVLDGGLRAWAASGGALELGPVQPEPGNVTLLDSSRGSLTIDEAAAFADTGVLLDVRAPERYRGEHEPLDPIAGHIPGALNLPTTLHLASDGTLLDLDQIRATFASAGIDGHSPVAAYCGSGITASHTALVLSEIGVEAQVFPGSWSQWSNSPGRSIAVGDSPTGTAAREGRRPLILGAMVRTLGAYPSGWRHPDAHDQPGDDAEALRQIGEIGEAAGLDYLFFGDWLATGPELEFVNPYLLGRIDPLSAITFLAGITKRIGLIATVNTTYADAYTLARSTASVDVLSGGRAGVNLVTGAEPRAAGNHGRDAHADNETRYDRAEEFVEAVRLLWESWAPDAWVADKQRGVLVDPGGIRDPKYSGAHVRVAGALNTARPPQGRLPIVHAGTSPRSRDFAARHADLALIPAPGLEAARQTRAQLRKAAVAAGRQAEDVRVIAPVLPVVAETREEAWGIVDELLRLLPLDEGGELPPAFPAGRSLAGLVEAWGLQIDPRLSLDAEVDADALASFPEQGQHLVARIAAWTGRAVGSPRPLLWRQVVAAWAVPAAFIVGTGSDIADRLQELYEAEAVDGFNVLSAFQPGQFHAFAQLVVPELRKRGLLSGSAEPTTLRDRLGLVSH